MNELKAKTGLPRTRRSTSATGRRTIRGSKVQKAKISMARVSYIPAGNYRSKVVAINDVTTRAGKTAIEIVYQLTDSMGKGYKIREIVPDDSWYYEQFSNAMVAAGVPDEAEIDEAVGVEEDVELVYDDPCSLGHFATRVPAAQPVAHDSESVEEAEEENFDFLEDDDD